MPIRIDNKPLETALLAVGARQPIPTRSKVSIATGLLWAAIRDFDPQLVPDVVLPALPTMTTQTDNGQSSRESVAKPTSPAPRSISDTDPATAPPEAESSPSTA